MASIMDCVPDRVVTQEGSSCLFPVSWSFDLVESDTSEIIGNVLSTLEPLPPSIQSVEVFDCHSNQYLVNVRLPNRVEHSEVAVEEVDSQSRPVFPTNDEQTALFYHVSLPGNFGRRFIYTKPNRYRSENPSEPSPAKLWECQMGPKGEKLVSFSSQMNTDMVLAVTIPPSLSIS